jgi:drug/metabolite transporter (DMT)-like permease
MSAYTRFVSYILLLAIVFIFSLWRYNKSESALKIISFLLGLTLISELLGFLMTKIYRNNMPVYHIYAPALLFVVALYYNNTLPKFRKYKVGLWIGCLGILASLVNIFFFQPILSLNSNFMLFEGVCIVAMALYAFYYLYTDDSTKRLQYNSLFWVSIIFLFYWCSTFVAWALMKVLQLVEMKK